MSGEPLTGGPGVGAQLSASYAALVATPDWLCPVAEPIPDLIVAEVVVARACAQYRPRDTAP